MTQIPTSLQQTFTELAQGGLLLDMRHDYQETNTRKVEPLMPVVRMNFDRLRIREDAVADHMNALVKSLKELDPDARLRWKLENHRADAQDKTGCSRVDLEIESLSQTASASLNKWMREMNETIDRKCTKDPLQGALRYKARLTDDRTQQFIKLLDHCGLSDEAAYIAKTFAEDGIERVKAAINPRNIHRKALQDGMIGLSSVLDTLELHKEDLMRNSEQPVLDDVKNFAKYAKECITFQPLKAVT